MSKKIILLDGGMGQELIRLSKSKPHPLWSTFVMLEEPELVQKVHEDYIKAGASVITLNTYSTTPDRLEENGMADKFSFLQKKAIDLAKSAINNCGKEVLIAGCLPPLVWSYVPEKAPSFQKCVDLYSKIVEEQERNVDLFICETMSSLKEAKAAVTAAKISKKDIWCAFSLEDNDKRDLRSGEPLLNSVKEMQKIGQDKFLLNCSFPEAINKGIETLRKECKSFGAYANGFTSIEPLKNASNVSVLEVRNDLGPEEYAKHALSWANDGASMVGGCCEIGPKHIKHLYQSLIENDYQIVNKLN
tara:strand:+ start:1948 stop:2856 length:909 start_codon:yes stop_codon:yes gene_type:complete